MRNIVLSSSRINDFLGCERYFNFTWMQGFRSKHANTEKMDMGTLFHKMAEAYYKAKIENALDPFADVIHKIMEMGRSLGMTKYKLSDNSTDIVVRTFRDYATYYKDEAYEIEQVEAPFIKELWNNGEIRILIQGAFDLLATSKAFNRVVIDHKTTSRNYTLGALRDQFICYAWASGCRVVVVNRILFKPGEADSTRFQRQPYDYSPRMIEEWKNAIIYRALKLDECERNQYYPPNFTKCEQFGKCIFYNVCNQDPSTRIIELEDNFIQTDERYDDDRFR